MLGHEIKMVRSILKRLEANKKRLLKQEAKINKVCQEYDKMLLTLIQR